MASKNSLATVEQSTPNFSMNHRYPTFEKWIEKVASFAEDHFEFFNNWHNFRVDYAAGKPPRIAVEDVAKELLAS